MKYIAILGSTGSIGTQTLEVVRAQQDIKVTALSAGDNIDLLEQQIREFRPALAAVKTEEKAKCLFKIFHKCDKAFFVYPVITVQHFHIFPNCIIHTCVDCRSMAPIGLTDHPDGIWMCFCIFHRNLFRPVC